MSNNNMYLIDTEFQNLEYLINYFTSYENKKEHMNNRTLQSIITNIAEILSISEVPYLYRNNEWGKFQYFHVFTKMKQLLYKLYKFEVFLQKNKVDNNLDNLEGTIVVPEAELEDVIKGYSDFDNEDYLNLNSEYAKDIFNHITSIMEATNGHIAMERNKAKQLFNQAINTVKNLDEYVTNELYLDIDENMKERSLRKGLRDKLDSFEIIFERYQHNRHNNDFENFNVERGLDYFIRSLYFVYTSMTIPEKIYVHEHLLSIISSCYDLDYKKRIHSVDIHMNMQDIEHKNSKEIISYFNQKKIKRGREYDFGEQSVNRIIHEMLDVFSFVKSLTEFKEGNPFISTNFIACIGSLTTND